MKNKRKEKEHNSHYMQKKKYVIKSKSTYNYGKKYVIAFNIMLIILLKFKDVKNRRNVLMFFFFFGKRG
jgi:hypothetical protein